jgi:hypothetical protein
VASSKSSAQAGHTRNQTRTKKGNDSCKSHEPAYALRHSIRDVQEVESPGRAVEVLAGCPQVHTSRYRPPQHPATRMGIARPSARMGALWHNPLLPTPPRPP